MGHHHHHHHHHAASSSLGSAVALNLSFALVELVGGLWVNSVAILSDALHDLGDAATLGLTWYFEKVSRKQRDQKYTYGYQRWSVLAALISSLVLLTGSLWILYAALPRLWQPEVVQVPGMLGLALLGIAVNGLAFWRVHGASSGERAARLHLLEDLLGWVAVLVGGLLMLATGWYWLDPVLSVGVALFILWNVFKNIRAFSRILLQAVPEGLDLMALQSRILAVEGVEALHDVHLWTLDSDRHVLSLHVVVQPHERQRVLQIKSEVKQQIREAGIGHDTLEMEYTDEACQSGCG